MRANAACPMATAAGVVAVPGGPALLNAARAFSCCHAGWSAAAAGAVAAAAGE